MARSTASSDAWVNDAGLSTLTSMGTSLRRPARASVTLA
jgi:hypothetical protein